MHKFIITQVSSQIVINFFFKDENIGVATLIKSSDTLRLMWIEVKDKHKSKGNGTVLLNYITDDLLKDNQNFQICVVDEEVLPFYFSFFEKKNIHKETIYDWVHDGDVHPEIDIPKGILNNSRSNKFKVSH